MSDILDAKITRKELLNKSDISNLIKNSDLNTKLKTLTAKADLKAEQDEIKELQVFDSSYFHGKTFFFLVMMVFKICLCTRKHLIHYS